MKRKKKKQTDQSPIAVPCTYKVQKAMLKNLQATATNKITSSIRKQKALEILKKITSETSTIESQQQVASTRKDSNLEANEPATEATEKPSRTEEFTCGMLGKIKAGFADIRQQFHFGFGNKINQPATS